MAGKKVAGSNARGFFESVLQSYEKAWKSPGSGDGRLYEIGGRSFSLGIAGSELRPLLTPALAHLERPGTSAQVPGRLSPDLSILAWDSVSTGVSLDHPWARCPPPSSRDIASFCREDLHILYNSAGGTLSLYDKSRRTACFWVAAADDLSFAECAAPFRPIFQWWLGDSGCRLVHSAAVGLRNGGGVLIPGGEGSGKSTTAALCLRQGFQVAGDDYVVLNPFPGWRAETLYGSFKLTPESMAWMPDLAGSARVLGRPSSEKTILYLSHDRVYRNSLRSISDLRAVLIPRISGKDRTAIYPVSAAEGIRALAPSTLYLQTGERHEAFRFLSDFVRHVPCHVMELGKDPSSIPAAIESFIRRTC